MREIFINSKQQLRAGWRIGIFIIAYSIVSFPFAALTVALMSAAGITKTMNEAILKLVLTLTSVIASYLLLNYIDKRKFLSLGMNLDSQAGKELGWGLLIGFLLQIFTVLIPVLSGNTSIQLAELSGEYFTTGFLINIILFIIVGFNEEILFRGYIFQAMTEGTGKLIAVLFFSILFGAVHLGNPNVSFFGFANIVLAGILLSLAYLQTRSLWLPIGIHIAWNFTEGYVLGLPVSGTTIEKPLTISQTNGAEWLTGGAFGPEGGAACTLICALACVVVWKFFKPSEKMNQAVNEAVAVEAFKPKETGAVVEG